MTKRRAVFTGIGVFSPLGYDVPSFWDGLIAARSNIGPVTLFDASTFDVTFAGELPNFDAKKFLLSRDARKALKMMARAIQVGVACSAVSMTDSGIDRPSLDSTRFGVEFGSSLIATEIEDLIAASVIAYSGEPGNIQMAKWGFEGIAAMPPLWMLKYLPNMVACHVSILLDAQGPNNSITESDAAGLLAIGEAFRILKRDQADFFLCGAADSKLNFLSLSRHCLFSPLSKRRADPAGACRPFEKNRDGWVISEGAGVLALEDFGHAQKRGAKIYGELVGFSSAFDLHRDGAGIARAIRGAMTQAGIVEKDVDHVNAHGESTIEGDVWEARGVASVFGSNTPVYAAKSCLGSMSAAGGPAELAASLLAFQHGVLPPTRNYDVPDPECPIRVLREPRSIDKPYAVKLSLTELGEVGAAVIRRWDA